MTPALGRVHSSASARKSSSSTSDPKRGELHSQQNHVRYLAPNPIATQESRRVSTNNSLHTNHNSTTSGKHKSARAHRKDFLPTITTSFTSANNTMQQQDTLDAVIIRDLTYEIGRGKSKKTILDRINLTVPEGSIYGLLGPSGCGKTTMLKCIVGRIWPKAGTVLVFGLRPGGGLGEVPGRDVGYMPQDISIYEDFTIEETLRYFGKINRLETGEIKRRIEFLLQFLDLPSKKRLVANLSGGQKRRVSLAAALVHSPPLLILDEPTVGVDPLLRQSIWQHLVAMTKHEKISVIITTHYIEEARLANVVGLMRNGRILAEASPENLMHEHQLTNLEDVFLKLCVSDSSLARASLRTSARAKRRELASSRAPTDSSNSASTRRKVITFNSETPPKKLNNNKLSNNKQGLAGSRTRTASAQSDYEEEEDMTKTGGRGSHRRTGSSVVALGSSNNHHKAHSSAIRIHTGTNRIELVSVNKAYSNEAVEVFSSEEGEDTNDDDDEEEFSEDERSLEMTMSEQEEEERQRMGKSSVSQEPFSLLSQSVSISSDLASSARDDYLASQQMHWAQRRSSAFALARFQAGSRDKGPYNGLDGWSGRSNRHTRAFAAITNSTQSGGLLQWWKTLVAVTWKNYMRLRRNPPVLVFQFMLPAIQVILFCLCIGGEPFDVPVAIVNEEQVPKASLNYLNGLDRKVIRQIRYNNLSSAIEAVRRGQVWGALHIPDKFSENLQSRLILGEEVTNETIVNGTIRVYPDLTNLHLAMTMDGKLRDAFIQFARDSIEEMGYNPALTDLPIKVGQPVYGTARKDGYLEFMAPGVVISISYVMATGLTALAFILERRDGLLERSLVSGVQTSQILLAHAINQIFVMTIQIMLVLGCTFWIFEIPSRGPFFWVVLLILLQGCTGMGFGLLVSAICAEENTAVMMVVGTFYTNLILAGIIWPIEAMPHWLRPVSWAQPQTLPTESLRHILSRGWGITESGVLLGFAVTIGWLVVFLMAAGIIFKYSR